MYICSLFAIRFSFTLTRRRAYDKTISNRYIAMDKVTLIVLAR